MAKVERNMAKMFATPLLATVSITMAKILCHGFGFKLWLNSTVAKFRVFFSDSLFMLWFLLPLRLLVSDSSLCLPSRGGKKRVLEQIGKHGFEYAGSLVSDWGILIKLQAYLRKQVELQ